MELSIVRNDVFSTSILDKESHNHKIGIVLACDVKTRSNG